MAKSRPLPPIDELRKRLAYRSDGVLIWKRPFGNRVRPGHLAGSTSRNGYIDFTFDYHRLRSHRVIWAIIKREDPLELQIDHINGNRLDNRIENLRKATNKQNQINRKNAKGFDFIERTKKWRARIKFNGKDSHIGCFETEEQAREAYLRAKEKLHGQFMPSEMKYELGHIDGPTSQLDLFND